MLGPRVFIIPIILSLVLFLLLIWADNNLLTTISTLLGCLGVGVFFGLQAFFGITLVISLPFEDEDIIDRIPRWIHFLSIGVLSIAIGAGIYYLLTLFPGKLWLHYPAMWLGCFALPLGAMAGISWLFK